MSTSFGNNQPSRTKRIPMHIDVQAIEQLESIMPKIFNTRQYKTPVQFTTMLTAKDDDSVLGELVKQNKTIKLPIFIIRRGTITPVADWYNPYIVQKYGIQIGVTKDRQHAITIFPTKVVYNVNITLCTDDFDILDHWIRTLSMYFRLETQLGSVDLTDPAYKFWIWGKFGENYDYPDFGDHQGFNGYMFSTQMEMSSYIVDYENVPTIGQIQVDPVVTTRTAYQEYLAQVTNPTSNPMPDIPAQVWEPKLSYTVVLRNQITDPAQRD